MKRSLAFVLGSTSNMAFATANVITSICKNCTLDFDIIVYENDFLEKDKEIINSIHKTKFINYDFPPECNLNAQTARQFTKLAFSRYECFKLLEHYQKVFWIDIDTLVVRNINDFITNFNTDITILCDHNLVKDNFMRNIEGYDMNKPSCNSGVFIISDKIKEPEKIYNYLYKKTLEYADILYCADQGIFCLMLEDFGLDVTDFGHLFNCHPTSKLAKQAYILHTFRPEKYWNFYSNKIWNKNYRNWLNAGGSKYQGKRANLWQKFWKTFFYDIPDPIRYPKGFVSKVFKGKSS